MLEMLALLIFEPFEPLQHASHDFHLPCRGFWFQQWISLNVYYLQ
jgi:hypothetical protein